MGSVQKCCVCGEEKEGSRLPRRWKRHKEGVWCPKCWGRCWTMRAVAVPVASPLSCSWEELRQKLRLAWSETTALANWCSTEYYVRDVRRSPHDEKLEPMPKIYLYPESAGIAPSLSSRTRSAICEQIRHKYRSERYELLWTHSVSLPTYRYPYPLPITGQALKVYEHTEQDGRICVSIELPGGRTELLLRGGKEFRRQIRVLRQCFSGEAIPCEATVYRRRVNGNGHRNGIKERDSGGQKAHYRVMVKIATWIPVIDAVASGTLRVRTAHDAMLVALNEKDERIWQWHADHVRRWYAEHKKVLQHWADDHKAEQRPTASFQSRRERAVKKHRNRIKTAVDTASKQLVSYARRRRFAMLSYDDSVRDWLEDFVWYELKQSIEQKCHANGIEFVHASGEAMAKTP